MGSLDVEVQEELIIDGDHSAPVDENLTDSSACPIKPSEWVGRPPIGRAIYHPMGMVNHPLGMVCAIL